MKAISAEELSKTFSGGTVAVDGIRFSLNQGEIFGFLGPNGAGKTTTVKLLCGMLTPSGGKCQVLGSRMPKDMIYQEIGDHIYDIDVASEHDIPLIVKRIVEAGGDVYHVSKEQLSLEKIYFSLIDREHAETECERYE